MPFENAKKFGGGYNELPVIILSCKISQGYLVLHCTNPVYSEQCKTPEGTGYGLKILKDMAKRYSGDFFIRRTEKSFFAKLSLALSMEDGGGERC